MKKVWLLWGLFLLAGTCFGQGVPYFSNVFTSANSAPPGSQTTMYTVPFSTVTVCGAIPVGNPCTNTVVIYANAGMTVTAHNPITTDVHGKFNFWAPAGTYSYSLKSASGTLLGTYYFTLGGSSGGSSISLQHNGTALANQNVLNFNDTTPAAPSGNVNVVFLTDSTGKISGYVPISASSFILTTTGTSGAAQYTSGTLNIPDYTYTLTVPKITALGTLTNDTSGSAAKIGGVAVSGTPGIGQLPVATGAGTASWQTISATGGISGQTTNCLLKANSATTSNASGPICDDGTTTTISHPVAINSAGPSQVKFTYNATPMVPAAGSSLFGADASGNAVSSDNGAAVSRVCTAANGICLTSSGFPITLGSTSVAASSTTTAVTGLTVNGVTLDATGGSTLFLNKAGGYTTPAGTGTVTTTGSPASGNLTKFSGTTSVTNGDLSGDVTTSGTLATTVASVAGTAAATIKTRAFGTTFGDTGGSALTSGSVVYFTVPYACTVSAWNMTVDAGTATVDIWKIASGTAVPTVTNTITASALPAISTGTAIHSTTLTGWTTAVTANDIFAFQLKTVATAKYVGITLQCNQ